MQHCLPTAPNIVGCYMFCPIAHPVACCWELLFKVSNQSNLQLTANGCNNCWELLAKNVAPILPGLESCNTLYRHIVHILVVILSYTYSFDHISFFFLSYLSSFLLSLIHSFIHSFIHCFVHLFACLFVCSFICSLIHSFIHSFIYSLSLFLLRLFLNVYIPFSFLFYFFFLSFLVATFFLFVSVFSFFFFSFCLFVCFLILCLFSILSQVLWLEQQTLKSYQLYSNLNVQFDDPSIGLQWYIVSYRSYKSLKQCLMISFQRGFFKTIIFKVKINGKNLQ